jgi:hypothetical protein
MDKSCNEGNGLAEVDRIHLRRLTATLGPAIDLLRCSALTPRSVTKHRECTIHHLRAHRPSR